MCNVPTSPQPVIPGAGPGEVAVGSVDVRVLAGGGGGFGGELLCPSIEGDKVEVAQGVTAIFLTPFER